VALGAALGDDLLASTDTAAPIHWASLAGNRVPAAPLPAEPPSRSRPMSRSRSAGGSLSQIGLVPDSAIGEKLQPQLRARPAAGDAGRRLVALGWACGRSRPTHRPPLCALGQRNRLIELEAALQTAEATLAEMIARHKRPGTPLNGR